MIRFLEYLAVFLLLVVLQEFVFDNINLGGVVNPYIYIMFIIMLPLDTPGWLLLLLGFGTGAAVDFMSGTPGLQAVSSTWLAFVRPAVVGLLLGKDLVYEGGIPTAGRVGTGKFLRYAAVMVLLFNIPFLFSKICPAGDGSSLCASCSARFSASESSISCTCLSYTRN